MVTGFTIISKYFEENKSYTEDGKEILVKESIYEKDKNGLDSLIYGTLDIEIDGRKNIDWVDVYMIGSAKIELDLPNKKISIDKDFFKKLANMICYIFELKEIHVELSDEIFKQVFNDSAVEITWIKENIKSIISKRSGV